MMRTGETSVKAGHSLAPNFLQLASIILVLTTCNGERMLYVRPDNATVCPSNPCLTITEYAEDTDRYITKNDNSTSFVFLPGEHLLDTTFEVSDTQQAISLRAKDPRRPTSIKCTSFKVGLRFTGVRYLHLSSLEIALCVRTNSIVSLKAVSNFMIESLYLHDSGETFGIIAVNNCTGSFANISLIGNSGLSNIILIESAIEFSGSNFFSQSYGEYGSGAIAIISSTVKITGTSTFANNSGGFIAGAIYSVNGKLFVAGNVSFTGNFAHYGGAGFLIDSQVIITGSIHISNNVAHSGGGLFLSDTFIDFLNDSQATMVNNSAVVGGGIFSTNGTALRFEEGWHGMVHFTDNFAEQRGGAVYVQDSSPLTYCVGSYLEYLKQTCFLQASGNTHQGVIFVNNTALEAGDAIYGGAIDSCAEPRIEFDELVSVSNQTSKIASTPFRVCACKDDLPDCDQKELLVSVHPGGTIQVPVAALGQRNGINSAIIIAQTTGLRIEHHQTLQRVPNECFRVSYSVSMEPNTSGSLMLYTDGPACFSEGTNLIVNIEVSLCPLGFEELRKPENKTICVCDKLLQKPAFKSDCNATDGTLLRDKDFWVGYDHRSGGLVLCPNCPFDYCITEVISFQVNDSDAQCRSNRVGVLCGQCPVGHSLLLGSSECKECSNEYLSLLVGFALAGILLLGFLLFAKNTVALGAINGLIFYANIVKTDQNVFLPDDPGLYLNFLRIFIAWLNLDFGIPTCFYDGMDAYTRTWLQYVFPFYLWFLMGLVFLACRYSSRISQIMGSNPVAAMATLFLLSYTKFLRTIIAAFSSVTLEYEYGENRQVWLYDGSVPFLDTSDVRHLFLFIFSLLILVCLFIPYTVLLFSYQWLLAGSNRKLLMWVHHPRVRSFLDAYHAPYKVKHRYWTGLLLLARLVLLVISAVDVFADPNTNLVAILALLSLLYVWAWINGGFYRNWFLDLLEVSFHFNLSVFAFTTLYIDTTDDFDDSSSQAAVATASLTTAFVSFVGITAYSVFGKSVQRFCTFARTRLETIFVTTRDASVSQSDTVNGDDEFEATSSFITSFWQDVHRHH